MSNITVSSDIDLLLRKSTKEEAGSFLGVQTYSTAIDGFLSASNESGARNAIGLGTTDSVEFAELATSQFNFPDLTTSELNAVTNAVEGDTYFDTDRGQFVRFNSSSNYDVITSNSASKQDSVTAEPAITLQASKFFESGLIAASSNVFNPAESIFITTSDAFGNASGETFFYNDGTGGVVTTVGWLSTNNPFGGVVTTPVVVPNKVYLLKKASGRAPFVFNKIITSNSPIEIFNNPLNGGSEYKIEMTIPAADLLNGNLNIDLNYTGLYNDSRIKIEAEDLQQKNKFISLSSKLIENDTLTFSSSTKLGVDSPSLGMYTLTMILKPSSSGTFSTSVKQVSSNATGIFLGKVETTITKLV